MKKILTSLYLSLLLHLSVIGQNHYVSIADSTFVVADTFMKTTMHGPVIFHDLKDSLKDGKWVLCYDGDSTKPALICSFKNKLRNGEVLSYDTAGNLSMAGHYHNGFRVGYTRYYYLGNLIQECIENSDEKYSNCCCRGTNKNGKITYSSRKHKRTFRKCMKMEKIRIKNLDTHFNLND